MLTPPFLAVCSSALAYFVSVGMVLPVLPHFVDGPLGGGDAAVGLVGGAFSFSAVVLRPFAGRYGDRHGRRVLVLAGAALAGISLVGQMLVTTIPPLVALRLLNGAGEALFFTGVTTAIADLAPPSRRGEAVSFFSVALYCGLAAGPFLGESLFDAFGFNVVWVAAGILAFAATALGSRIVDARPDQEGAATGGIINRNGLLLGLVLATSVWGFAGFSNFVPLYSKQIGMSGSRLVFGCYAVTILLVRALGARIPDRLGARRTATISLVVTAAGLALMGAYPAPATLFAGTLIFALGQALAFPALITMVVNRVSAGERASVIATFTAFLDIAFGLGPVSLGLVAEGFGYRAVFLASALVAAGGLALLSSKSVTRLPTPPVTV